MYLVVHCLSKNEKQLLLSFVCFTNLTVTQL